MLALAISSGGRRQNLVFSQLAGMNEATSWSYGSVSGHTQLFPRDGGDTGNLSMQNSDYLQDLGEFLLPTSRKVSLNGLFL